MLRMGSMDVGYVEDAELGYRALVFRDSSGDTFEIQRAFAFDQQDRELAMETYCLVVQASATCYGGISEWLISDDTLQLVLQLEAAEDLGLPRLLRIPLTAAGKQIVQDRLATLVGP